MMPILWPFGKKDYDNARFNDEKTKLVNAFVKREGKQPADKEMETIEQEARKRAKERGK